MNEVHPSVPRRPWTLSVVLVVALCFAGCGPAADDGGADAEPDMGEVREPRPVTELWPLVLEKRDTMREIMTRPDLWEEDLERLEVELMALLELVTEAAEWAKANGYEGREYAQVMRGLGDVRIAVLPIRQAIARKMPMLWKQGPRSLDQALAAMENRFPKVEFPESVRDRPDYETLTP